ncbi:MAG: hypothetical protein MUF76_14020 [Hydrogenophaga sp.]|jgi:hypothetical protein|nr:hypothetical protein [Hydrogenophaga sp.]
MQLSSRTGRWWMRGKRSPWWAVISLLVGLVVLAGPTGCASQPRVADHSFSFHGWNDGWAEKVDLLAYNYGGKMRQLSAQVRPDQRTVGSQSGTHGVIPVGDFLYVKWRLRATGEMFEKTVDLKGKLPEDMKDHEITFVIDGGDLYVYLVTPTPQPPSVRKPPLRTWRARFNVAREIYPTLQQP